jgi:hypothetical protein
MVTPQVAMALETQFSKGIHNDYTAPVSLRD